MPIIAEKYIYFWNVVAEMLGVIYLVCGFDSYFGSLIFAAFFFDLCMVIIFPLKC